MELRRPRVLFLGYYGSGNLGDEAILGVTLAQLRDRFPGIQIIVPGDDPAGLVRKYHVISYSWQDVSALIGSIREADLVVVGGGGLLHDYWPPRPETALTPAHFGLSYYCGMGWLAGELGKPVFLYAAGVGPLLYRESRDLVRALARVAIGITVRDSASQKMLEELGLPPESVEVTADPAWLVQPADPPLVEKALRDAGVGSTRWMAVALRNWDVGVSQERWEREVLTAIGELARRHNMGIVFLPFQHMRARLQDDVSLAEKLAQKLSGIPVGIVRKPCSASLARALAGRASLMVGMRFHSVLFAADGGTPTIALAYDPKVTHLAGTLGEMVEVVRLGELEAEAVITAGEALLSREAEIREASLEKRQTQRGLALKNIERLEHVLRSPPLLVPSAKAERIASDVVGTERIAKASGTTSLFVAKVYERQSDGVPTEALHEPIHVIQKRLVRIVTPSFFDPTGSAVYSGGGERYAMEMVKLIRELGWDATIVQPAHDEGWERQYDGVLVQGLGGLKDRFSLGSAVERRLAGVPLTIFHAFYLAGEAECRTPAIGISHGIYWDDVFWAKNPEEHRRHRARALEAVRRLDLVVSVDANTINWVRSEAPELTDKMVHIPNFVDLNHFRCRPAPLSDHPVVLFPRRLCAARGYWLLAKVAPQLLERRPHLELHLVGDADVREAEHARRLVERYAGRVKWYVLPPNRMHEAYERASIVLIPTVASEGASLSLLEAQACGKAVVATAVGGLMDLVIDGFNALVVQPDPAALGAAIERLLDDPKLVRELGTRASATARQFGEQHWRERWARVLRSYLVSSSLKTGGMRPGDINPLEERST